jgi:hypothetical protein
MCCVSVGAVGLELSALGQWFCVGVGSVAHVAMGSVGLGAVDIGAVGWINSVRLAFDLNVALGKIRTVDCSTATLVNGYLFIYVLHSIFTRRRAFHI